MVKIAQIKQKIVEYSAKTKIIFLEVFVPQKGNNFLPKALKSKYLFLYSASLLAVKIALISLVLILPATDFFSSITASRLVSLINQERQSRNLPALALNDSLNSAAGLKVNDMATQGYFEHTSPAGITPWFWFKQIGYNYVFAGENLAMGFTETDEVFAAWMNSPTHRANILNPNFREMGLAVGTGNIQNRQETLAVLEFGKQAAQQPAKTRIAQPVPAKNTPAPSAPKSSPAASPKPAISSPSVSVAPAASPATVAAVEKTSTEQIDLKTILGAEPQAPKGIARAVSPSVNAAYAPRVLGAFVSRSDEIFKSLYLYFTLFLAIALLVNIFVKMEIQYWTTIGATTFVILLSAVLIFI
ncbi:MAG: CAP domain-containing protein [Candidatus Portnoybacteria bacterium]|nr:CAP domain-containing protein [Candidatus Portnoybacteria bacterium]MDD4983149.1 CAP domain-containing protein [Candidatus Portnoybacteria bacterium]